MKRMGASLVSLLFIASLAACAGAPEPPAAPAGPSNDDLVAIRKMDSDFRDGVIKKDWDAVGRLFADRAVMLPPNAPLVAGASSIVAFFKSNDLAVSQFSTTVDAIGGSGNLAVSRGSFRIEFAPPGAAAPTVDVGKYVWVLQRQADQSWRVTLAMWNADAPPQTK